MSNVSKRKMESNAKNLGSHDEFLKRVTKTLYYGKLPSLPCLSLPVTELAANVFSQAQKGKSLKRLHIDTAADITRNACVSPCSLILALLYLERLKTCNPEYLAKIAPSELFLVSLMVSNKFLQDDGEDDEVFCDEWAASGDIDIKTLKKLELAFLKAMDWRLFISEDLFQHGLLWLEQEIAMQQGNRRGWFTYTELSTTLDRLQIKEIIRSLTTVYIALSLSYLASISTLILSSLMVCNTFSPTVNQTDVCHPIHSCNGSVVQENIVSVISKGNNEQKEKSLVEMDEQLYNDTQVGFYKDSFKCCDRWAKFRNHQSKPSIYANVFLPTKDPKLADRILWRSTLYHWLYQSSLIAPIEKNSDNFLTFIY